jgi:hypothetical protein
MQNTLHRGAFFEDLVFGSFRFSLLFFSSQPKGKVLVSVVAHKDWARDPNKVGDIFGMPAESGPGKHHSHKSNADQPHLGKSKQINHLKPHQL